MKTKAYPLKSIGEAQYEYRGQVIVVNDDLPYGTSGRLVLGGSKRFGTLIAATDWIDQHTEETK